MNDTFGKLSKTTIILHWIVGLTIISLLAMGIYMEEYNAYQLYDIHKAIGVIIFFFILYRVWWRIQNGWPVPAGDYTNLEHITAKLTHYILLVSTILLPLSGILNSGFGGHGIDIFGLPLIPENPDPLNTEEVIPFNALLAQIGAILHTIVGDIIIIALILHIAGALKHHIIDKDGTLKRMLGSHIR